MKKPSFTERFRYWFDNHMSRGSLSLIRLLAAATLAAVFLLGGLVLLLGFSDGDGPFSALWDSFATIINAWMPYYGDGSPGYLVLMALGALFGILFTSLLIGIISSAIEERLDQLKKGTSRVLEKDHYVILGYEEGRLTLIRQLVLAADGRPRCILVTGSMDKDRMEEGIRAGLEIPRNIRLICRSLDAASPADLEKCAIPVSRSVILSPSDDLTTARTLLAVTGLLRQYPESGVRICAILAGRRYMLPGTVTKGHAVSLFQTREVLARLMAHSCTQSGLAGTFEEIFSFEGMEFYVEDLPALTGLSFGEVSACLDQASPLGICRRAGEMVLAPGPDYVLEEGDRLIVFEERPGAGELTGEREAGRQGETVPPVPKREERTLVIGTSEVLHILIRELPEDVGSVFLAGLSEEDFSHVRELIKDRKDLVLSRRAGDPWEEEDLLAMARDADHVVVLHDHKKDRTRSDIRCAMLVLKLRDLRTRYALRYNITAELHEEGNRDLISFEDGTADYIVASNMMSLLLAQLAENPLLSRIFTELLSNEGNELYLKRAGQLGIRGTWTGAGLRALCLDRGYVFLGCHVRQGGTRRNLFNPELDREITLEEADKVIVLGPG